MVQVQKNSVTRWRFSLGQELPCWQVCAENDAQDSNNPIHDNRLAQQLGFGGGLVPGVTLYGYLTHPLIAVFGRAFLQHGSLEVRFRRPVYAGETVTTLVRVSEVGAAGCEFQLELRNAAGEACAVGRAQFPADIHTAPSAPAKAPLPQSRRPATPEELRANPLLGSLHEVFTPAQSATFVASLGDSLELYQTLVHPSWLLRQANYLLDRNLALGPWIHTESRIQHLGLVQLGEPFTVQGEVVELSTRKGNDYADIDVLIATSKPVLRVLHRAIYRMPLP